MGLACGALLHAESKGPLRFHSPSGRFDLVVTDFGMPGMNGTQLARILKQLVPSQPILMITGFANALEGSQDSVDAILPKPFSLDDLRQAISQLLS